MSIPEASPPSPHCENCCPKPKKIHWFEGLIFVFVVVTAIATAFAAYYTREQWRTSADTEKQTLRAYVTLKETLTFFGANVNPDPPHTRFIPGVWENSGNTPTTNFEAKFSCTGKAFEFADLAAYHITNKWILGPHQTFKFTACPFTAGDGASSDIVQIMKSKTPIFASGEAIYGDIFFTKRPQHITRFCLLMSGIKGNPFGADLSATFLPCKEIIDGKRTNCTDDECDLP
jgi:hypothetical protein